jgi:prepilin-type processing-associated H-X9-DG protein
MRKSHFLFAISLLGLLVPGGIVLRRCNHHLKCAKYMQTVVDMLYAELGPSLRLGISAEEIRSLMTVFREHGPPLTCPISGAEYSFYFLIDRNGDRTLMVFEPLSSHAGSGGNVFFPDGHVRFARTAEWNALKEALDYQIVAKWPIE